MLRADGRPVRRVALQDPEDAEYFSENHAVCENDRFHGIIFRLQADVISFPVESLDSGGIIYQSHYDITVRRGITAFHKNLVSVKDADIYHGISFYP